MAFNQEYAKIDLSNVDRKKIKQKHGIETNEKIKIYDEIKRHKELWTYPYDLNKNLSHIRCHWDHHTFDNAQSNHVVCPLNYTPKQVAIKGQNEISTSTRSGDNSTTINSFMIKENIPKYKDIANLEEQSLPFTIESRQRREGLRMRNAHSEPFPLCGPKVCEPRGRRPLDEDAHRASEPLAAKAAMLSGPLVREDHSVRPPGPAHKNLIEVTSGYYETDGVFCSPECCLAFINDEKSKAGGSKYIDSERLLHSMLGLTQRILPANHYRLLEKYGGKLTIEQFRNNNKSVKYEYHGTTVLISHLFEKKLNISTD